MQDDEPTDPRGHLPPGAPPTGSTAELAAAVAHMVGEMIATRITPQIQALSSNYDLARDALVSFRASVDSRVLDLERRMANLEAYMRSGGGQ